MSTRSKLLVSLPLAVIIAGMLFLPLLLLRLPNPKPVRVEGLPAKGSGAYIGTKAGVYRLYPYAERRASFPANAPMLTAWPRILIKYRQLAALGEYALFTYPTDRPIGIRKRVIDAARVLELTPAGRPEAGRYYVAAARDGVYGGTDYYYFVIGRRR